jgi:hypothetical protein
MRQMRSANEMLVGKLQGEKEFGLIDWPPLLIKHTRIYMQLVRKPKKKY